MIRYETKKRIWTLSLCRRFFLKPVWDFGGDVSYLTWLWFSVEATSIEWLDFCDRHGGGFGEMFDLMLREIEEDAETKEPNDD